MRAELAETLRSAGGSARRANYMDATPVSAAAKIMLGGGPVLATGILIGSS